MGSLPGLLSKGRVYVDEHGRMNVDGPVYADNGIWTATETVLLILVFNGHELLPGGLYNGLVRARENNTIVEPLASPVEMPDFTDQGIEYDAVEIERWLAEP